MPLRKTLLKVMLWSLAGAAVLGAACILLGGPTVMWRVSGTTVLTAVSAGLLMAASALVDRPQGRKAGLFAMCIVLIEALLVLVSIWGGQFSAVSLGVSDEALWLTVIFLFLTGLPATVFLYWQYAPATRLASLVGLAFSAAVFVLLMIPTWNQRGTILFRSNTAEWFGTAMATTCFGLTAVISLIGVQVRGASGADRRLLLLRVCGTAASAIGLSMAVWGIWNRLNDPSEPFIIITTIAVLLAHANLCLLAPLQPHQRWIRFGTIAAAVIAAIGVDWCAILLKGVSSDETAFRVTGAAAFVACCGSLALIVFARINRKVHLEPRAYRASTELTLVCPGCSKKQTVPVGASQCPTCRLRFEIRVEEPHCPNCDYVLFMLTSDRCPECGTEIGSGSKVQASAV